MNTLAGLLNEPPVAIESPELDAVREPSDATASPADWIHEEQIQGLVQQLFFQGESRVRHVGFTAVEAGAETAQLCLNVATALAATGAHDVGLIDAGLQSVPLHSQLEIELDGDAGGALALGPRLWLVPRSSWLGRSTTQRIWDPSLSRLRAATMEFDHSVVAFDSLSWVTARISQICDGLVLVLTANKTRRLVAVQVREQLKRARVPVLGVVLAERHFPVPERLYRSL